MTAAPIDVRDLTAAQYEIVAKLLTIAADAYDRDAALLADHADLADAQTRTATTTAPAGMRFALQTAAGLRDLRDSFSRGAATARHYAAAFAAAAAAHL